MVHASSFLASPLSSVFLNPHFVSHMISWLTLVQELERCVLLEVCWLALIGKIKKLCKESYNELFRCVCMHVANTCMHLYAKRIDQ